MKEPFVIAFYKINPVSVPTEYEFGIAYSIKPYGDLCKASFQPAATFLKELCAAYGRGGNIAYRGQVARHTAGFNGAQAGGFQRIGKADERAVIVQLTPLA